MWTEVEKLEVMNRAENRAKLRSEVVAAEVEPNTQARAVVSLKCVRGIDREG